ncbi:cephalosporin hydroxylase family protein [Thiobacillus sp.]|nr:cephalosporin hydroxylase family protein [Thiobacillus sp.]
MTIYEQFKRECAEEVAIQGADPALGRASSAWMNLANPLKYSYHFKWLGRPIIQYPQDMIAMQEIIWSVQPDLIIETGIAHGGSLIFSASMLELNAGCGGPQDAEVLGLDIDIRPHNREAIEGHPMFKRITMIEGSSIDDAVAAKVHDFARGKKRVLVILDSNHTHVHVRRELVLYSSLVKAGSYLIVFDTVIEDMPEDAFPDRPWGKGDNPKTAVWEFLESNDRFEINREIQDKLLLTVAPDGYLKCLKD